MCTPLKIHIYIYTKNRKVYLRFTSNDAIFGRHTGHITTENSISNSTSAKATSKYDRAAGNKVENI